MTLDCHGCNKELDEVVDTTHSNFNSNRALRGQHTGDIYYCDDCDMFWIEDLIWHEIYEWTY